MLPSIYSAAMIRNPLIIFVTAVFDLLAAPLSALAHAHLNQASPAAGSTVAPAPNEVVLSFSNKLEPAFSTIEVQSESGVAMHAGNARIDPKQRTQMRVTLKPLAPGTYKVIWRVLSVDTHAAQGDFTFRVGK